MNSETYNILRVLACFELEQNQADSLKKTLAGFDAWDKLQSDAELHAVAPLAYRHFRDHDIACPSSFMLGLQALTLRHRSATRIRHQVLSELVPELEQRDISLLGIKGVALAPLLYPDPAERPMRDMDILIAVSRVREVSDVMRSQGFSLPRKQPSRYDVLNHHLPNATLTLDGMTVSVEVHKDAINNDSFSRITWEKGIGTSQGVHWEKIMFKTLGHELMLLQLCRHLAGTQSTLKLINVLDVVAYADRFSAEIDWPELARSQPFVINALRCLHLVCPLSERVRSRVGLDEHRGLDRVGENMIPVSVALDKNLGFREKMDKLFHPPEWWLYLHYGVRPARSLWCTRLITHPFYLGYWLLKRLASRLIWSES